LWGRSALATLNSEGNIGGSRHFITRLPWPKKNRFFLYQQKGKVEITTERWIENIFWRDFMQQKEERLAAPEGR